MLTAVLTLIILIGIVLGGVFYLYLTQPQRRPEDLKVRWWQACLAYLGAVFISASVFLGLSLPTSRIGIGAVELAVLSGLAAILMLVVYAPITIILTRLFTARGPTGARNAIMTGLLSGLVPGWWMSGVIGALGFTYGCLAGALGGLTYWAVRDFFIRQRQHG